MLVPKWNIAIIASLLLTASFFLTVVGAEENGGVRYSVVEFALVSSADNGGPVTGAIAVYQEGVVVAKATTNENGAARIELVPGNYSYYIEAKGYRPVEGKFHLGHDALALTVSMEPGEVERPVLAVEAMMVDSSDGKGIAGILIIYHGDKEVARGESNERGLIRIELLPGEYAYSAEARGYTTAKGRFSLVDKSLELKISMGPTKEERPRLAIEAMLKDSSNGNPVMGIMVIYLGDNAILKLESNERGLVRAELPAGDYHYTAESKGYNTAKGRFSLVDKSLELKISLDPAQNVDPEGVGVIAGKVTSEKGGPLAQVTVTIMSMDIRKPIPMDQNVNPDGTLTDPTSSYYPGPEVLTAVTDREGVFKVRAPWGLYQVMVEFQGFEPFFGTVQIGPDNPEARMEIVLLMLQDQEPPVPPGDDFARFVTEFGMVDSDSDGFPEKVHLLIDMEGDGVPELVFDMVDEDSDGNPEEVGMRSSLPLPIRERLMVLIMMLIQGQGLPFPELPDDPPFEDPSTDDGTNDNGIEDIDWEDLLERLTGDEDQPVEEGPQDPETEEGADDDASGTVTEKGGSNDSGPSYLLAAGAVLALFLLMLSILTLGVLVRTSKKE